MFIHKLLQSAHNQLEPFSRRTPLPMDLDAVSQELAFAIVPLVRGLVNAEGEEHLRGIALLRWST